ncbi:hypothetical protein [Streptomyces alboflavus]|uniref:hypothetical protein n=1 Tax=Streptomyces alboflavus TaxID=67267 RepID=UPI001F1FCD34|nr:hypothetical protein [Streptomyces alboflavus]
MTLTCLSGRLSTSGALALVCAATVLAGTGHADGRDASAPGTSATHPQQAAARGSVVSVTPVLDLDAKEVEARMKKAEIDERQVRHGVRAYRIVYRTVDTQGRPTTASQLVAVPRNGDRHLRVVSWLHGTEVFRGEWPRSTTSRRTGPRRCCSPRPASRCPHRTTSAWGRAPDPTPTAIPRRPSPRRSTGCGPRALLRPA